MITVTCDGCEQVFTVYQLGVEVVQDDIERNWFPCPSCGREYTSHYTNRGIRELKALLRKLSKNEGKKYAKLRLSLKKRIGVGMERLRQEVETG